MSVRRSLTLIVVAGLAAAACVTPAASPTPTVTSGTPTAAVTPTASASPTASPSADACAVESLEYKNPGRLTIGTNNPAYYPYFLPREGGNTEPWDPAEGDPTTGEGFESAVAFAVAEKMGFSADEVDWVVVDWLNSFAPGDKTFDFDINETAITAERSTAVDFSEPYYDGVQAVIVDADGPFADATTITELKSARLGAMLGTTSYAAIEDVIQPTTEIKVFDSNDDAMEALANVTPAQLDGVVVDLPTAFYMVNVQYEGMKVLGKLGPESGATPEQWGLVMQKGTSIKGCVDQAVTQLREDGTLDQLVLDWLDDETVPEFQP